MTVEDLYRSAKSTITPEEFARRHASDLNGVKPKPEPPRPLMRPAEPATPFSIEALGPVLANAALAIHDKVQAPLAICGTAVLAAATLSVQALADVVLPTGQSRPLSLFFATIAASGERKSSVDNEATVAVTTYERELRDRYAIEMDAHDVAEAAWKAERASIISDRKLKGKDAREHALRVLGPAPSAPLLPMVTAPEPTYEGLCRLFAQGQPSIGLFSAEGGQFIGGHAMSDDNKVKTASGLSTLWDNGTVRRARAADGSTILVGRRLAAHLMVQERVSALFLADEMLQDQGLLSRFLVTAPESSAGTRKWREPDPAGAKALEKLHRVLGARLRAERAVAKDHLGQRIENELAPREINLSADARAVWIAFVDHVEDELAPGGTLVIIKASANKLAENAMRIAGVLALIDNLHATEIGVETMVRAIELVQHYGAEAARLARAGVTDPATVLAARLLEWLHKSWREPLISLPDVYQRSLHAIPDKKTAAAMVAILVDHGWLLPVEGGGEVAGVRRQLVWKVVRE